MKIIRLSVLFFLTISLISCVVQSINTTPSPQTGTVAVPPMPPATIVTTQTGTGDEAEEAVIRDLIYNFGKRLQYVSLLAPDVGQQMRMQYGEFISPALLELWMHNLIIAPGRKVSSPWPDRIEITTLDKVNPDKYSVSGYIIEVTSAEVASGDAANRIPVQIVVERMQSRWLITEFIQ